MSDSEKTVIRLQEVIWHLEAAAAKLDELERHQSLAEELKKCATVLRVELIGVATR